MKSFFLCLILSLIMAVLSAKDPSHCFDILDITPKSQTQRFYDMSFVETSRSSLPANMLSCYLMESRYSGDEKTATEKNFDIYKKCTEYMKNTHEPIGKKQLIELTELGLQYFFASYLKDGIKSNNKNHIEDGISYIAEKMAEAIGKSTEFNDYKKFILRKIEGDKIVITKKQFHNDEQNLPKSAIDKVTNDDNVVFRTPTSGKKSHLRAVSFNILFQYLCLLTIFIFL